MEGGPNALNTLREALNRLRKHQRAVSWLEEERFDWLRANALSACAASSPYSGAKRGICTRFPILPALRAGQPGRFLIKRARKFRPIRSEERTL